MLTFSSHSRVPDPSDPIGHTISEVIDFTETEDGLCLRVKWQGYTGTYLQLFNDVSTGDVAITRYLLSRGIVPGEEMNVIAGHLRNGTRSDTQRLPQPRMLSPPSGPPTPEALALLFQHKLQQFVMETKNAVARLTAADSLSFPITPPVICQVVTNIASMSPSQEKIHALERELEALKSLRDAVEGCLHAFVTYTSTGMGALDDEVASELLHHITGSVCQFM
jgi:hypothetical protein